MVLGFKDFKFSKNSLTSYILIILDNFSDTIRIGYMGGREREYAVVLTDEKNYKCTVGI